MTRLGTKFRVAVPWIFDVTNEHDTPIALVFILNKIVKRLIESSGLVFSVFNSLLPSMSFERNDKRRVCSQTTTKKKTVASNCPCFFSREKEQKIGDGPFFRLLQGPGPARGSRLSDVRIALLFGDRSKTLCAFRDHHRLRAKQRSMLIETKLPKQKTEPKNNLKVQVLRCSADSNDV